MQANTRIHKNKQSLQHESLGKGKSLPELPWHWGNGCVCPTLSLGLLSMFFESHFYGQLKAIAELMASTEPVKGTLLDAVAVVKDSFVLKWCDGPGCSSLVEH